MLKTHFRVSLTVRVDQSPTPLRSVSRDLLSDPSPIIGNACQWLTHWLTHSCLVNLINVILACEDANSKLVEVVTVVDVDAEDHVGNSLLQIWELTFGPKTKLLFRLWAQGLVQILNLKFRENVEAGVCSAFCRWCFVEVINLWYDLKSYFGKMNSTLGSVVPLAMFQYTGLKALFWVTHSILGLVS